MKPLMLKEFKKYKLGSKELVQADKMLAAQTPMQIKTLGEIQDGIREEKKRLVEEQKDEDEEFEGGSRELAIDERDVLPRIYTYMDKNRCRVMVGVGSLELDKHGYKQNIGWGSIADSTAASVLYSSGLAQKWRSEGKLRLFDPFCGSGSFLLEALIAAGRIPIRTDSLLTFKHWPIYDQEAHNRVLAEIKESMHKSLEGFEDLSLLGTDISNTQLRNSWSNFESLGNLSP